MSNTSSAAPRRLSVARASSAASRVLRGAADLASSSPAHPDVALLAVCADYGRVRRRIDALFKGRRRITDEDERQRAYATLSDDGAVLLAHVGALPAHTLDGHRARAGAFLSWDEGELIGRARRDGMVEDRLLAALLLDLVIDAG